jgi:hypothetical protein
MSLETQNSKNWSKRLVVVDHQGQPTEHFIELMKAAGFTLVSSGHDTSIADPAYQPPEEEEKS